MIQNLRKKYKLMINNCKFSRNVVNKYKQTKLFPSKQKLVKLIKMILMKLMRFLLIKL